MSTIFSHPRLFVFQDLGSQARGVWTIDSRAHPDGFTACHESGDGSGVPTADEKIELNSRSELHAFQSQLQSHGWQCAYVGVR